MFRGHGLAHKANSVTVNIVTHPDHYYKNITLIPFCQSRSHNKKQQQQIDSAVIEFDMYV